MTHFPGGAREARPGDPREGGPGGVILGQKWPAPRGAKFAPKMAKIAFFGYFRGGPPPKKTLFLQKTALFAKKCRA